MNYLHDVIRAQQRMTELANEAATDRLIPTQPGMSDHLLAIVGTWMINTGERLTQLSALDSYDKKLSIIKTANG